MIFAAKQLTGNVNGLENATLIPKKAVSKVLIQVT